MRTHVPGVVIPDALIERMRQTPRERWQDEGMNICVEIIQQVREIPGVAGVHVMAYRQEHMVAEIIHRAGLYPRVPASSLASRLDTNSRGEYTIK
jgi:methylenetetrahydrofolate reductase (NADPH)